MYRITVVGKRTKKKIRFTANTEQDVRIILGAIIFGKFFTEIMIEKEEIINALNKVLYKMPLSEYIIGMI